MPYAFDQADVEISTIETAVFVVRWAERIVGVVFGWAVAFVALVVPIGLTAGPILASRNGHGGSSYTLWAFLLAGAILVVHGTFFVTTLRALRRPGPLGIEAALLAPRWTGVLRPIAAVWWAVLFVAGSCFALFLETSGYLSDGDRFGTPAVLHNGTPGGTVALIVGTFGLTFAGNTFLLLAVSVFTRRPRVLSATWRFRLLVDAVVMIVPAWLNTLGVWR